MRAQIDAYSRTAIPLEMRFRDTRLALGTGFFWRAQERAFLITNWHNVTGKNPNTGEHLSKHAGEPDRVVLQVDQLDLRHGTRAEVVLPLRSETNEPLWLEHSMARCVDIVALPLPSMPDAALSPINEMPSVPGTVSVGDETFILGYPFGIGPSMLPIWKRASIASEPNLPLDGKPCFYVDTASRSGMSGSPVILRRRFGIGPNTTFVGVYSGRIGAKDELEAQLGIVWRAELVDQIVTKGRPGSVNP